MDWRTVDQGALAIVGTVALAVALVGIAVSGGSGVAVAADPPNITDPTPANQSSITVSYLNSNYWGVQVNDSDLPQDFVGVELRGPGGDTISGFPTNIGSNQTINSSLEMIFDVTNIRVGANNWSATAVDLSTGDRTVANYTFDLSLPLVVNQETAPESAIDGVNTSITMIEQDADDPVIIEGVTDSNGELDVTGLPADETFIADMSAPGYYNRTAIIADIVDQNLVYLLNKSVDATDVTFNLQDRAGFFPPSTSQIVVERVLNISGNSQYRAIAGEEFGPGGATMRLERGERYRIVIRNRDTDETQVVGQFRPSGAVQTVDVIPRSPTIDIPDDERDWYADATWVNASTIEIRYVDKQDKTTQVDIRGFLRSSPSSTVFQDSFRQQSNISASYQPLLLPPGYSELGVVFNITRNGSELQRTVFVAPPGPRGNASAPARLEEKHVMVASISVMMLVGGLFSVLSVAVGAVVVSMMGAIAWWLGWLGAATTGAAVVIALATSIIYYIGRGGGVR